MTHTPVYWCKLTGTGYWYQKTGQCVWPFNKQHTGNRKTQQNILNEASQMANVSFVSVRYDSEVLARVTLLTLLSVYVCPSICEPNIAYAVNVSNDLSSFLTTNFIVLSLGVHPERVC